MTTPDIEGTLLPDEAAKFLGISTQKLARLRRDKRVHGERIGTSNLFVYRIADLRKADLKPRKRGPKTRKQISNVVQN